MAPSVPLLQKEQPKMLHLTLFFQRQSGLHQLIFGPKSGILLHQILKIPVITTLQAAVNSVFVRIDGHTTHYADDVDQINVKDPVVERLAALSSRLELMEKMHDDEYMTKASETEYKG